MTIAFDSFLRNGVRGTSLADIAREAGVRRGSLYHAYGSEEALFLKAYDRYAEKYIETVSRAPSSGSLRKRLQQFFEVAIDNFVMGNRPRGCPTTRGLMELSAPEGDGLPEQARHAFADLLTRVQTELEAAFQLGLESGEFRGDPRSAAELVLTIARGLVVPERAFSDANQLRRIVRSTIELLVRHD